MERSETATVDGDLQTVVKPRRTPSFHDLRPALVLTVALAVWVTALALMATARWDGDPAGFARFGDRWQSAADFAKVPRARLGYDGQFYATIATDPLFLDPGTREQVDEPWYRGGRILVPLVAWLLSFGNGALSVRMYVLLCWVLAGVAVIALDRWQRREQAAPEWGLVLFFAAGVVASVTRALPDAAALGLMVLALRAHGRGRGGAALALGVAAVLCRETSLLACLAMALTDLRGRRPGAALAHATLPVLAAGAWRLWLRSRLGPADFGALDRNLGVPFGWLAEKMTAFAGRTPIGQLADLLALTSIALAVGAAIALVGRWRSWQAIEATYAAFAALAVCLTFAVYDEPFAYSRVLLVLPLLGLPVAARQSASATAWLVRGSALLGAFGGVVMLWIELVPALRRLLG